MLDPNPNFRVLMDCMIENDCMPRYPEDGICLATDDQALQTITDIEQLKGTWPMPCPAYKNGSRFEKLRVCLDSHKFVASRRAQECALCRGAQECAGGRRSA